MCDERASDGGYTPNWNMIDGSNEEEEELTRKKKMKMKMMKKKTMMRLNLFE